MTRIGHADPPAAECCYKQPDVAVLVGVNSRGLFLVTCNAAGESVRTRTFSVSVFRSAGVERKLLLADLFSQSVLFFFIGARREPFLESVDLFQHFYFLGCEVVALQDRVCESKLLGRFKVSSQVEGFAFAGQVVELSRFNCFAYLLVYELLNRHNAHLISGTHPLDHGAIGNDAVLRNDHHSIAYDVTVSFNRRALSHIQDLNAFSNARVLVDDRAAND